MAQIKAKHKAPTLKPDDLARGDVTGIIGMVGNKLIGSLSITFSKPAILEITKRMLGEEVPDINDTVTDLVGEITNMVTGGAKKLLAEAGHDFNMATPTVVTGVEHEICHKAQNQVIQIPFESSHGPFYVEISFEDIK